MSARSSRPAPASTRPKPVTRWARRTTLDLLNAQADLFRALRELQQAKCQVLLDRLTLAKAVGELDVEELRAVNANLTRD